MPHYDMPLLRSYGDTETMLTKAPRIDFRILCTPSVRVLLLTNGCPLLYSGNFVKGGKNFHTISTNFSITVRLVRDREMYLLTAVRTQAHVPPHCCTNTSTLPISRLSVADLCFPMCYISHQSRRAGARFLATFDVAVARKHPRLIHPARCQYLCDTLPNGTVIGEW
jgi:hypothetical protein